MKTTGLKILFIALLSMTVANAEMIRIDTKEVVIDTDRKLMWQDDERTAVQNSMRWQEAMNFCHNLVFSGFDNWYLPDLNQLNSIKDLNRNYDSSTANITNSAFQNQNYESWSSTELDSQSAMRGKYSFNGQNSRFWDMGKRATQSVRCVRDMQSNESVDRASIDESNRQETLKKEREAKIEQARQEKAAKEAARKFVKLGNCEVGETVYHREAWDSKTSSGNILADALFNASIKESFIIEFEGVVKGFVGKKVEVYLQDYSVKQTRGGGFLQPATGVGNSVSNYADKRIGKSHFFDKSRCGN